MKKHDAVLVALSATDGHEYSPVQIQKLCFLYDRKLAVALDGPHFDFQPYHYGPFDKDVYACVDDLEIQGLAVVRSYGPAGWERRYAATLAGLKRGTVLLDSLEERARTLAVRLAQWVLRQSFSALVSTIYNEYPDMKVNSIFADA